MATNSAYALLMAMRRRVALMVLAAAVQMFRPPRATLMAMRRVARGGAVGLRVSSGGWGAPCTGWVAFYVGWSFLLRWAPR